MSFDTHRGTRGNRQPKGRLMRWANTLMARRVRKRGAMMGFNTLVLLTVGRRSGAERVTPVGWFPGPDGARLVVASANGAADNPAWYYNVAAHPDRVRIEVDGRIVAVTAEQLHGAPREQAWQQIIAAAPRFARYQEQTDRELPIIQLIERPA
ncbi:nitroreductase family deazaflavin-dependent oxidoreductase [Dactylosporangium sp. NBC_01737]|uniref:nitroreductase/quinone reductase family protein n=1 Tax=Dactylosporangium sp. NBC_01737 TaxID=2975959 RepID=UPI002E0DBDFD|nr:nitroreductase family deazaflavin-dependent oxidoreductase [Dactylosporangium sp. NBC_01737]